MARNIIVTGVVLAIAGGCWVVFSNSQSKPENSNLVLSSLETAESRAKEASILKMPETVSDLPVPSKTGPWPKAAAKETSYLFGRMQVRDTKTHQFVIQNEGQADLELKAGKTTCKCTQFGFGTGDNVTEKTALVKPGESVVLTMSWKAGDAADREFRHGGDVYTNDPDKPELKFSVQGAIEMPFELLPYEWNVGDIYDEKTGRMTATLGSRIHEKMDIVSIESPSGKVTVVPSPVGVEEQATNGLRSGYSLAVSVASDIPSGIFEEEVLIRLAQQEDPIRVTVTARKLGSIRIQQMAGTVFDQEKLQLHLGSFPAAEGREAKLLLIVDQKGMTEPFALTQIQADPSFLKAELSEIGAPSGTVHRYLMTVSVPPGRPHVQRVASKPGNIRISTNHSSGEVIQFSVLLYSN